MVILEQQIHNLCQIATGHKRLAQYGVSAQMQAHSEFEAQRGVTSQCLGIGHKRIEILIIDASADSGNTTLCKRGASE